MANYDCNACEELRQDAPSFVVNGLGSTEIASLKNNTGLSPSNGNNDCTDLNNMNDCLIGNMESEIDAYDVCNWKDYMRNFVNNVWTMFGGVIAAICGLWTNIASIRAAITKLQCQVNFLFNGFDFEFGEYSTDTKSYIVAGKGVSFLNVSSSGTASDLMLRYVAGGLATLSGSLKFYNANFTDGSACYNFDNGATISKSASRLGNTVWNATDSKPIAGGELCYEIRIKMSEYPQIKSIYPGIAREGSGGGYHAQILVFNAGEYAFGQHGECNRQTGASVASGGDAGHQVPTGWKYVQMRISYIDIMRADNDGAQYSPYGLLGIRMKQEGIDC